MRGFKKILGFSYSAENMSCMHPLSFSLWFYTPNSAKTFGFHRDHPLPHTLCLVWKRVVTVPQSGVCKCGERKGGVGGEKIEKIFSLKVLKIFSIRLKDSCFFKFNLSFLIAKKGVKKGQKTNNKSIMKGVA